MTQTHERAKMLLFSLSDASWRQAYREAKRCGIIQDGHYGPEDIDVLLMYVGAAPLDQSAPDPDA